MYQITITETISRIADVALPPIKPEGVIEHARIQTETLDVAAVIALIYKKPRKQRTKKEGK